MPKITIYSTPKCHYCKDAKEFLSSRGYGFEEHNVSTDLSKRKEMIEKSGGLMVPVIEVNDRIFVGFDNLRDAVDKKEILN